MPLVETWLAIPVDETKTARIKRLSEQTGAFVSLSRCNDWAAGARGVPAVVHNQMLREVLVDELGDRVGSALAEKLKILK